jgi:hypothetical protein
MSARSRKSKVYGDFLGDVRKEPKEFCKRCQRWIPPCYFKRGKPVYIHTCYDAKEADDAI